MYDEEYDNDFGMSDDELLYREMNPEDPWYMGPSEDNIGETGACWDSMGGIKQCRNLHFRAGRQD